MKIKIYALVHPTTKEIVYVGQTTKTLIERLKSHYWKLNEANRGERTLTPLFKYLNDIKPLELEIVLLTEVESNEANEAEIYYIAECRKGNPMAKPLNPKIVVLKSSNDNSVIRSFDYVFEINQFLDDRNAGGNIVRQLKKKPYTRSKGYVFRYINDKDIEKLNN